ncbi:unnamed protein product [Adineta ricciae]|uniref:Major facilitator superfamily (MFS) profile domain-containing protein n=1 Tax=Adineta ricciae TaxID=249248 RepID=A0A814TM17_ADIRI|nr:unnamed protein product [Adineta ricciae]
MLSARYDDDQERGRALGQAMSGMSIGVMIGPVYGGLMYNYVGKLATFLVLAGIALVDGLLRLIVITPGVTHRESSIALTFWTVACNPRVLTVVGVSMIGFFGIAMFQAILPLHIMASMNASILEQTLSHIDFSTKLLDNKFSKAGQLLNNPLATTLPCNRPYVTETNAGGSGPPQITVAEEMINVVRMMIEDDPHVSYEQIASSLWIRSLAIYSIPHYHIKLYEMPMCQTTIVLVAPLVIIDWCMGMIYSASTGMLSQMAAEYEHSSAYGHVFAVFESVTSLVFIISPITGGFFVQTLNFTWAMNIVAVMIICYTIFFILMVYFVFPKVTCHPGEKMTLIRSSKTDTVD